MRSRPPAMRWRSHPSDADLNRGSGEHASGNDVRKMVDRVRCDGGDAGGPGPCDPLHARPLHQTAECRIWLGSRQHFRRRRHCCDRFSNHHSLCWIDDGSLGRPRRSSAGRRALRLKRRFDRARATINHRLHAAVLQSPASWARAKGRSVMPNASRHGSTTGEAWRSESR
jgi:hypothetical protein